MPHPRTVKGYKGSLEQLATAIGNMTYDRVAEFIDEFTKDIRRQEKGDRAKGRKELARVLYLIGRDLDVAKVRMDYAWRICKPYHKRNKNGKRKKSA